MADGKFTSSHAGHRQRIAEKLDTKSLCDHELLEIMLFNGLPRQNTNVIAHKLMQEFGSIEGVMTAPFSVLRKLDGIGDNVARYVNVNGQLMQRWIDERDKDEREIPAKFSYESFMPYIKKSYQDIAFEVLDAYALDDAGRILCKKRFSSSLFGKVEVEAQMLIKLIYAQDPTGIILVHNHPQGDANPSQRDDFTTAYCQKICEENGVIFCDHFIYSKKGVYSYYLNGEMQKLSDLYDKKYKNWLREFVTDEKE